MFKNKLLLNVCTYVIIAAFAISFVSCDTEEEGEVQLSRLFRPGSFSRVVDGTNVSLSWLPIKNASYLIEYGRLASGLPFDSIKDMQVIELERGVSTHELYDLWGSTRYGIRIKAVSIISGTNDSEWVSSNFTTDAENILYPLTYEPNESDFNVHLIWQSEKEVSHIIVNNLQLGVKTFEISSEEKISGEKTLLNSSDYRFRNNQQYTISIWLGERKRGEKVITIVR